MCRILLIAPDQPDISSQEEIRSISEIQQVTLLHGNVTPNDIYSACRHREYNVIHYATHSNEQGVQLSNNVIFSGEDVAQSARVAHAEVIFFNSCLAGKLASHVVSRGIRYSIYCNVELEDADAWKGAITFYNWLQRDKGKDVVGAYKIMDNGNGLYGINVDPSFLLTLLHIAGPLAYAQDNHYLITERTAQLLVVTLLLASILLSTSISILGGILW